MKIKLLLFEALLLISCSFGENKKEDYEILLVDSSLNKVNNLFDIIDDVEIHYINGDKPLANIKDCIFFEESYYFLSRSKVYITNVEGKLLYEIDKVGKGPGEYSKITSFNIHPKDREIYLYDFTKQTFHIYDLQGNFLRDDKIGYNFMAFEFIDNLLYLFTAKHRNKVNDEIFDYDILILNEDRELIDKKLWFDHEKFTNTRFHKYRPFFKFSNTFLFNDIISDTIYQLNRAFVKKHIFKYSNASWSKEDKKRPHSELPEIFKSTDFKDKDILASLVGANKDFFIYTHTHNLKANYTSFFSLKTKKVKNIEVPEWKQRIIFDIKDASLKGKFVSVVNPLVFPYIKEQYQKYNKVKSDAFTDKLDTLYERHGDYDGQFLFKFKVKTF